MTSTIQGTTIMTIREVFMPWKPGPSLAGPMYLLLAVILFLLILTRAAYSHMEDAAGCFTIPKVEPLQQVYAGISEDERDYIKQYDVRGYGRADMEEHYILLPKAQWKGGKPTYLPKRMSVWIDNDEYTGWDHWYIDPRGQGNCLDYVHMMYDKELGVWRLYVPHHEDRRVDNREELQ